MADRAGRLDPIGEARRQWVEHGWDEAADGMAVITSVTRVHQIFMHRIDVVLRPMGLTFARYEILVLLSFGRSGAMPMRRVGSRLQVHPTSITSAVDRLEAQGYVERRSLPSDRRAVLVHLTDTGRDIAAEATKAMNAEVFSQPGLSSGDLDTLARILGTLRAGAGDF